MMLVGLKHITAEPLWSEPSVFEVEVAIQKYKWPGTDEIPTEIIFHIFLWYLTTRLIHYFCTQTSKLAKVQPCESIVLCGLELLILLLHCFIGMVFCLYVYIKSYLMQPFNRTVWTTWLFGTNSDCWWGLSILQCKWEK